MSNSPVTAESKGTVVSTQAKSTVVPAASTAAGRTVGELSGRTTIQDNVVAKLAGIAAREVTGVYALGGGAARVVGAIRDALNSTDLSQGISVEVGERQVAVDVTIVAQYPASLQKVADDVRASVYRAMEELVGMEVAEVNVVVNDVHIDSDDDDKQPAEARVQ